MRLEMTGTKRRELVPLGSTQPPTHPPCHGSYPSSLPPSLPPFLPPSIPPSLPQPLGGRRIRLVITAPAPARLNQVRA